MEPARAPCTEDQLKEGPAFAMAIAIALSENRNRRCVWAQPVEWSWSPSLPHRRGKPPRRRGRNLAPVATTRQERIGHAAAPPTAPRGSDLAPRSVFLEGRYGRMFRYLPPFEVDLEKTDLDKYLKQIAEGMLEPRIRTRTGERS